MNIKDVKFGIQIVSDDAFDVTTFISEMSDLALNLVSLAQNRTNLRLFSMFLLNEPKCTENYL